MSTNNNPVTKTFNQIVMYQQCQETLTYQFPCAEVNTLQTWKMEKPMITWFLIFLYFLYSHSLHHLINNRNYLNKTSKIYWFVLINPCAIWFQLKLMATVHQTQPTIQLLLSTSDFVGALDLITTTQEVLEQELAGIQSFR